MEYLEDALRSVIAVLPKVLLFLVILIVGWIVARLLLALVTRLLERLGFDRAVERGGLRRWMGDYSGSRLVGRLVYYGVLLLALQMAFGVFGTNPISDIIASIVAFLPRAFVALVILVIAAAIASAVKDVITSALGGLSYGRILATAAQVAILAFGVIAALAQIGVATTVTTPVLVAILATIGGVIVVGVGGGLVQPMRDRWERWLARGEAEMRTARARREETRAAGSTPPAAGAPQPSYAGQGVGAAVDPAHPRASRPAPTSEEPTVSMPQPGTTQPGMTQPERGGTTYRGGSTGTP